MESSKSNGVRTAARLTQLRRRIERWRLRRAKRSPMPAEPWTAATELARELGVYRVARELRVGYGSLKERLDCGGQRGGRAARGFVEIAVFEFPFHLLAGAAGAGSARTGGVAARR
jgi:hypothetical protein